MARKVVNRKELRAENEAAEQAGTTKKKAKKKAAKRASRAKSVADVRMKLFWACMFRSSKGMAYGWASTMRKSTLPLWP